MSMKNTLENYRKVFGMLRDEESKNIYLNRLNWLISGDLKYFSNIIAEYIPELPDRPKLFKAVIQGLKAALPPDRGIVFYGAGQFAPTVLRSWGDDKRLIGFCSQTKRKQEDGYWGYPVMSPETLLERKDLSIVLSVELTTAKNEIKQVLREGNYPADQIYEIPDVPASEKGHYFSPDFMSFGENEVFIDAGCYDLGTTLDFMQCCKHVKRIYAFEPDPQNYQTCLKIRDEKDLSQTVDILPYGTWSTRTTLQFNAANNVESHICAEGKISVPVVPIDEIVKPEDKVTMIKMDVEGSELESLRGARQTIQRDKPKLAICIYHKPEDMVEIPLYIKELAPEYRLYVRHHSNAVFDTVLYAVML